MEVRFITRNGYNGWGDLIVDGVDQGWNHQDDAERIARQNNATLAIEREREYAVRNPRREEDSNGQV